MMQSVLHLLEPLRLPPTGGRDTEFPARLYFRMHRQPLNACSIQMLAQGKSMPLQAGKALERVGCGDQMVPST